MNRVLVGDRWAAAILIVVVAVFSAGCFVATLAGLFTLVGTASGLHLREPNEAGRATEAAATTTSTTHSPIRGRFDVN